MQITAGCRVNYKIRLVIYPADYGKNIKLTPLCGIIDTFAVGR